MRIFVLAVSGLALALVGRQTVLAESEFESGNNAANVWPGAVVRPQHDVSAALNVSSHHAVKAGKLTAKLVVRSKGTKRDGLVPVTVFADSSTGAVLWSGTVNLHRHRHATRKIRLDVPVGASSLVAVAAVEQDDNPGNNMDTVEVEDSGEDSHEHSTGGTTGGTTGTHSASAVAGAATFATNCASCHGAGAKGTRSGPRILGRSSGDVYEAMREGEDGMPRFLQMTKQDAANIAAFLADPSAATSGSTNPTQPPAGQSPTYSGQIQALLAGNCTVCHQGTNAPQNIRLDTYATASANATVALAAMQAGRMPPGGPMSTTSINLFADWVNSGKSQ